MIRREEWAGDEDLGWKNNFEKTRLKIFYGRKLDIQMILPWLAVHYKCAWPES